MKKPTLNFTELGAKIKELNPKEYYAWPLMAQLSVGAIVLLAVVATSSAVFLIPQNEKLEAEIKKEDKLKDEFVEKKKQAINLPLYQKQLAEITSDSEILLKQLPDKSQIEKLLIDINQAALGRDLKVELFKPGKEKVNDFYAELPIDIKVSGSYDAIGNFTSDAAQLSRVVLFTDMEIVTNNGLVTLTAVIKTFRYLDEEEIQAKLKEKARKEKKSSKKSSAKKDKEKEKEKEKGK